MSRPSRMDERGRHISHHDHPTQALVAHAHPTKAGSWEEGAVPTTECGVVCLAWSLATAIDWARAVGHAGCGRQYQTHAGGHLAAQALAAGAGPKEAS